MSDDWGKAWGEDPEAEKEQPKKTPRKDTMFGMITYFSEMLPRDSWGKLNSPVNVPAMSKGLKKLTASGLSPDQIRGMMKLFIADITAKPLGNGIAPWRAFLANLDSLALRVTATNNIKEPESYDDLQADKRFGNI